jgi:hypothetical protein
MPTKIIEKVKIILRINMEGIQLVMFCESPDISRYCFENIIWCFVVSCPNMIIFSISGSFIIGYKINRIFINESMLRRMSTFQLNFIKYTILWQVKFAYAQKLLSLNTVSESTKVKYLTKITKRNLLLKGKYHSLN